MRRSKNNAICPPEIRSVRLIFLFCPDLRFEQVRNEKVLTRGDPLSLLMRVSRSWIGGVCYLTSRAARIFK